MVRAIVVGLVLAGACGCANRGNDYFIPKEAAARDALEAALNAWKNGERPGKIAGASVPIEVADSRWLAGQKLSSFEIIQEDPSDSGMRWFTVKLNVQSGKGKSGSQTVRYVVVGKDPLWVYREEDYKRPAGM